MNDRRREKGHLMVGVMAAVAIMLIFSTVTFQAWQDEMARANEAEMIFRGQEYARAIVRYRKDRRVSPEKLEDLIEPGSKGQYYLRQLYDDPLVKDGKWGLLFEGPNGTIIDPSAEPLPGMPGAVGGLQSTGMDRDRRAERERLANRDQSGRAGRGDQLAPSAGAPAGLRIAGVKSLCEDDPFRIYNGFENYDEWLFTFQDLEQPKLPGQGQAGQPGQGGVPGQGGLPGRQSGSGGLSGLGGSGGGRTGPNSGGTLGGGRTNPRGTNPPRR